MPQQRDYYEVLGVGKQATADEIKKAYRKKAIKYHPDKNQGDEQAESLFKEATEAYEVLSNQEKRQIYDTYGFDGVNASFQSSGGHDFNSIFREFGDIFSAFGSGGSSFGGFESIFGNSGQSRTSRRATQADINVVMRLSLEEVILGTEKSFKYERYVLCNNCDGTKSESKTPPKTCSGCGGTGQSKSNAFGGFFSFATTCNRCGGEGVTIENVCRTCNGQGIVAKKPTIKVTIPKGVHDRHTLTLKGQGHKLAERQGNMNITIEILPDKYYVRDYNDLITVLPIDFVTAAVGGNVVLKNILKETITITIPDNTHSGSIITVKNKGVTDDRGNVGDLKVTVEVVGVPRLSRKSKDLLKQLKQEIGDENNVSPLAHNHYG